MLLFRYFRLTAYALIAFLIVESNQSDEESADTSLFDWVAYNLLEDYVDLLEMSAWFGRKVKDHIDELIEESFVLLTKQQEMLQPALQLAEQYNRPDCAEGKIINVTDVVFREYFNMNINCPMIGQKMAVFFNELHNISEHIVSVHRRHINMAPGCGPPHMQTVDRNCLQNIINEGKKHTSSIRDHMVKLTLDIDDFMDGQMEEAFICSLTGMSNVRNVTKQAVQDIHCCLDIDIEEHYEINKKYQSPLLDAAMGRLGRPFDNIDISKEKNERMMLQTPMAPQNFQYHQPLPPVAQHPHPGMANYPPPPPPPPHQQFYGHPGMAPPPPPPPHPGMPPHHGMPPHPGFPPQHGMPPPPGMPPHPGVLPQPGMPPYPGIQPQFVQHPAIQPKPQGMQQPPPGWMQPGNPLKSDSKSPPPWRVNPANLPNYVNNDRMIRDGSFEFDPSIFDGIPMENTYENGMDDGGDDQFNNHFHDSL